MRHLPPIRIATLAERAFELRALKLPGSEVRLVRGGELRFDFSLVPSAFARLYHCRLLMASRRVPAIFVVRPNLQELAKGRALPHVYKHDGPETKLCLWLPRKNEWTPQMRLLETYLSWTSEWLNYFEEWLLTEEWAGGGEHPVLRQKRWATNRRRELPQ